MKKTEQKSSQKALKNDFMIKQGLKNYLKGFKFFFTPLGVIALCCVIGVSVAVPGIIGTVNDLVTKIVGLLNGTSQGISEVLNNIAAAVSTLDWSNPIATLTNMDGSWIQNTISTSVSAVYGDTSAISSQISSLTSESLKAIDLFISVFAVMVLVGLILSYFITRKQMRSDVVGRLKWKLFLVNVINTILNIAFVVCWIWLASISSWGALISVVFVLIYGVIALFEAYFLRGRKKIPLKSVLKSKNVFMLFLTNLLILLIDLAVLTLIQFLTNSMVSLFVGIALIEIAFIVLNLNAESFVNNLAVEAQNSSQTQETQNQEPAKI